MQASVSFVQQASKLFVVKRAGQLVSVPFQAAQPPRWSRAAVWTFAPLAKRGLRHAAVLLRLETDDDECVTTSVPVSAERVGASHTAELSDRSCVVAPEVTGTGHGTRDSGSHPVLFRKVLRHDGWKELAAVAELRTLVFSPYAADPYFFARRKEELYTSMRSRLEVNPGRNHTFVLVPRDPEMFQDDRATPLLHTIIGTADVTEYPHPSEDNGLWFGPGYLFPFLLSPSGAKTRHAPGKENTVDDDVLENVSKAGSVYISGLAIAPTFRRRGLGRLVLLEIQRWTRRRHLEAMYLHVERHNTAGLRLYETFGFRPVQERETMQLWKKRTGEREHLLMWKPLEPGHG